MRLAFLVAFCLVLAVPVSSVLAASSVAMGAHKVFVISSVSAEQSEREVSERCQATDTGCRVLVSCNIQGFGAVATAMKETLIEAVGAVCGYPTARDAQLASLDRCREYTKMASCKIRQTWLD